MQRVLTTLGHKEPDRVPFVNLTTMHPAKDMGISLKEYFSKAENVVQGQLSARKKYDHDALYGFFHAPMEILPWGGEVLFSDDGPPNSGRPFIKSPMDIKSLKVPDVSQSQHLNEVLIAIRMLKEQAKDEVPIFGVAMGPFSLPVMQMGFDNYFNVMYEQPELFEKLMDLNQEFCVAWSNAQIQAGATAIVFFDPVASPTIVPKEIYLKYAYPISKQMIAKVNGPVVTHFASGTCLPIIDEVAQSGVVGVGVSAEEDLTALKAACKNEITLVGNLNGVHMRRWTPEDAQTIVKSTIAKAGPGGGFILTDNHGEIPYQVPEEVLLAISEAVHKWGKYPLTWIEHG